MKDEGAVKVGGAANDDGAVKDDEGGAANNGGAVKNDEGGAVKDDGAVKVEGAQEQLRH